MKNHTNKLPFGCAQCNLGFKLKIDLVKHCETAHNGIVVLQSESDNLNPSASEEQPLEPQETVIQYILDTSEDPQNTAEQETNYTVVNISDVSAFQNAHTVIQAEDGNTAKTRILSSTLNEDGTTTLMVTTAEDEEAALVDSSETIDDKTVVFLRIPEETS